MSWRVVYLSNPCYLSLNQSSLVIDPGGGKEFKVPLDDIGAIVLDHHQIVITHALISEIAEHQIAMISINKKHTPNGVFLPFMSHSRVTKIVKQQINLSVPFKKRLWQSTVTLKIENQLSVLQQFCPESQYIERIFNLSKIVKSGDSDNIEAQVARFYFPELFGKGFTRDQDDFINAALNFGYAIIRSALARSIVAYGFIPSLGIHHDSELNAFNLADDLIEPYRAFVDFEVMGILQENENPIFDKLIKARLASLLTKDAIRLIDNQENGKSSLLSLTDQTVMSLTQAIQTGKLDLTFPRISL